MRLEIIDSFKSLALTDSPAIRVDDCRDPNDNKFLEPALTEMADCLITGDQDLLVLNPYNHIPILTARDFLHQF